MTKKDISPEIAVNHIRMRLMDVLDSVEDFAATLVFPNEEFKSKTYNNFRDAHCVWGPRGREYEQVALSTLINYGIVRVARSEFKERIVEDYWGNNHNYRINGEKIINEYEMNTLLNVLPDIGSMVKVEEIDGKPVQTKTNYYVIDFGRIEELERIKQMLAAISE